MEASSQLQFRRTSSYSFSMTKNNHFGEDVLECIFSLLESNQDRDAVSLVCKYWYKVEGLYRKKVTVRNCYVLSPLRFISRCPKVKALTLKGYPRVDDSVSIPHDWGGFAYPWIEMLAEPESCSSLEELKLKRMVVTDETLELISRSFPNFKSLVLIHCVGFSTDGLAAIAANCRFLEVLDLEGNTVTEGGHWLDCFPESFTSLVTLNFADVFGEVDLEALEKLVGRCPNLKSLKLSEQVPIGTLQKILVQAPHLVDLGIGSFVIDTNSASINLYRALLKCKSVCTLSGFFEFRPTCLFVFVPICSNLISLNLTTSDSMRARQLILLISECRKLQRLWVLDCIGDEGLEAVASTCKELQELRIFSSRPIHVRRTPSETGLISISTGCPKLHSLHYLCYSMTNVALSTVAKYCPNLTCFSLRISDSKKPDNLVGKPFDEGFRDIVRSCKKLKHLSISGLLTDRVFFYIGFYAEQLETLTVEFSEQSDTGILYVLNGCSKLRKLVLRNSPIGDAALLEAADMFEKLQLFWMSGCNVTLEGCKAVAKKVPRLNIEMLKDDHLSRSADVVQIGEIYMYKSLDGPRNDAPGYLWTL